MCLGPVLGVRFLTVFGDVLPPFGPSWGALGVKTGLFSTLLRGFPEGCYFGTTLVSFWTTLGGFGEHFGRIWGGLW